MNDRISTPLSRGNWHQGARFWLMVGLCALVWGGVEATFGWVLHGLRFHGIRALMFPVGLTCMSAAFYFTGRARAVGAVAWVAAAIKLCDLFIGGHFRGVVSPAVNMVIEGSLVAVFFYLANRSERPNFLYGFAVGVGLMVVAALGFNLWRMGLNAADGTPGAMVGLWEPARLLPQLVQVGLKGLCLVVAWRVVMYLHVRRLAARCE